MPYKDPEAAKKRARSYYLANKQKALERAKAWSAENKERRREICRSSARRLYKGSTQENRNRAQEWQKSNPEKAAAKNARWAARHPEKHKRIKSNWREKNPARISDYKHHRRAREKLSCEKVDRFAVYERDGGICGICKRDVERSAFEIDHIVPLSRGGLHRFSNTQTAHPRCNRLKSNKLDFSL